MRNIFLYSLVIIMTLTVRFALLGAYHGRLGCGPFIRNLLRRSSAVSMAERDTTTKNALGSPPGESYGVYIHIPFCRRRCYYCDFSIKVIGERESTRSVQSDLYTEQIIKDMENSYLKNKDSNLPVSSLDSIYFGGGTPSLLSDKCIEQILARLQQDYGFADDVEITLEMDPGTFTLDRLHRLHGVGINRVSMGVQSFDDQLLKACGRAHSVADINAALDALHRSPIDNFSIDLISSLPHMTVETWANTLKQAAASSCTHVSVYDLQIEENTAFGRWYTPGEFPLPSEESAAEMYTTAVQVLTSAGFEHYEVSNYARNGKRSRHNQKYWSCSPVLAFGMSAASYVNGVRFTRPRLMKDYIEFVSTNNSTADYVANDIGSVAAPDPLDRVMLSLRTADGLSLVSFQQQYGREKALKVLCALKEHHDRGTVLLIGAGAKSSALAADAWANEVLDSIENESSGSAAVRLSDPEGFLLSNEIISDVFAAIG